RLAGSSAPQRSRGSGPPHCTRRSTPSSSTRPSIYSRRVPARRRLLVLNQYYWPGVEATAHLLTELCEALAVDYDVTVVRARLRGREDAPAAEVRNGVRIVRVRSSSYDRARLGRRGFNYATYLARAAGRALALGQRPDVILCMTDPPMAGALAILLGRRYRA